MAIRAQIESTLLAAPDQQHTGMAAVAVPGDLGCVVVLETAPSVGGAFAAFL